MTTKRNKALLYFLWPKNLPVLRSYLACVGARDVVTMHPYCSDELRECVSDAGGELIFIEEFSSLSRNRLIQQQCAHYAHKLSQGSFSSLFPSSTEQFAAEALSASLNDLLPTLLALVSGLDEIASERAVELAVLNEDTMPISKTVCMWARDRGIPSLHILHNPGLHFPMTVNNEQRSDHFTVLNEYDKALLVDAGFSGERIHCTGLPQFDEFEHNPEKRSFWRSQICQWHGLNPEKPIVVYGTTWSGKLTSLETPNLSSEILHAYFSAIKSLGKRVQHIIKDRPGTGPHGEAAVRSIAKKYGVRDSEYVYVRETPDKLRVVSERPLPYLCGSDLVVATNSGLLVEAICCGTRALNVLSHSDFFYGPAFSGDCGIRQTTPEKLSASVLATLEDPDAQPISTTIAKLNSGHGGRATQKIVSLMSGVALPDPKIRPFTPDDLGRNRRPVPVWKSNLADEDIQATNHHGVPRKHLVDMSLRPIRCALDIGCATGGTGAYIKEKYPYARVIGIEANRAAARIAEGRLDKVLVGKFEDIDLAASGIQPGDIDTVIVADGLEHMFNPWAELNKLQRYLSSDGQIIASIPNVRNLKLMEDLAGGFWRYESTGLLDITNVRFFTLREIRRLFHETGYHIRALRYAIDPRLQALQQAYQDTPSLNVQFGRMSLNGVSQEELKELCSLQFHVVAQTGALAEDMELYWQVDPYLRYLREIEPTAEEGPLWEQHLTTWPQLPQVELLVFDTRADIQAVIATIDNLARQLYHNVILTIVSNESPPEGFTSGERLRWVMAGPNENLLSTANRAIAGSRAAWMGRIFAGDKLEIASLLRLMELAHRHPEALCLYGDDDSLIDNQASQPRLKPDFDPDLLLGWNYLDGLTLFRREVVAELGGFDETVRGAETLDLALKVFERAGSAAFHHLQEPVCHRPPTGNDNDLPGGTLVSARQRAIQAHLDRTNQLAKVANGWQLGTFRVDRQLQVWPKASILMPVSEQAELVQRAVEAIFEKTRYPDFELLILDNATQDPDLRNYLEGLDRLGDPRLQVFTLPEKASLPNLFNLLAGQANGDILVNLDYQCTPTGEDWLEALAAEVWRPEIGAVAPRLLDGKGQLVGSGLIAGCGDSATDAFAGRPLSDPGPNGRAHLKQRFSALPFGCLVLRREVFEAAQGFDTQEMSASQAALDLTLRLTSAGLACLWTPYTSLHCAAGKDTLDRPQEAEDDTGLAVLYDRHLSLLARDPAYHPGFSMTSPPFLLEARHPLFRNPLPWRPLPKILATHADTGGCGNYRIIHPAKALNRSHKATVEFSQAFYSIPEIARIAPDALVFQRQITDQQLRRLEEIRRYFKVPVHYELDDLITGVPRSSPHFGELPKDVAKRLQRALALSDSFIVSTEALRDAYSKYHSNIQVIPNRLPRELWKNLGGGVKERRRPRVGWSGSISHTGDLLIIMDVVKTLASEVDWIFMGHCPSPLRPFLAEYHHGVPFAEYPEALAALDLDLAIAPLEYNQFNECKSNLKLLEYGALGYPVIATDIVPYQGNLPVTLVKNKHAHWVKAIREHISDMDELARKGASLQAEVEHTWMLDDHTDQWLSAWLGQSQLLDTISP